jgi:hypothetical protein
MRISYSHQHRTELWFCTSTLITSLVCDNAAYHLKGRVLSILLLMLQNCWKRSIDTEENKAILKNANLLGCYVVWLLQEPTFWRNIVFLCSVLWLLVTANIFPSSPILVTLTMEAIRFSETLVLTRATQCYIPEDGILHSHHGENLKSYKDILIMKHGQMEMQR